MENKQFLGFERTGKILVQGFDRTLESKDTIVSYLDNSMADAIEDGMETFMRMKSSSIANVALEVTKKAVVVKAMATGTEALAEVCGIDIDLDIVHQGTNLALGASVASIAIVGVYHAHKVTSERKKRTSSDLD